MDLAEYAEALKMRFRSQYEALMEELMNLRQTGSLDNFDDEVDAIACKVRLSDDYLVPTYTAVLDPEFPCLSQGL